MKAKELLDDDEKKNKALKWMKFTPWDSKD